MKISTNMSYAEALNLHNKVNKTTEEQDKLWNERANNQALDRALYLNDLSKVYEEQFKAENLAKKLAKGESLTKEERAYLEKVNPQLLKDAEKAKQEAENLKNQLKNAKDKQTAQKLIEQASFQANAVAKYNKQYADLLKEAISKVCSDEQGYKHDNDKTNTIDNLFVRDSNESSVDFYS
ncbi:hypothetical protein PBV87_12965 [Niameybacter massiliensis]|uniref:Uncharacterized protein n=1 Tax=Holtiella tumoricola TaxID=3018743 RepID=A0AA42DNW4_9FIRM|nr:MULTISPECIES: hypothetical protein [Lachnospirales]MDA3732400.1 hypothetical protein [Holtiella tumoricola]